MQTSHWFLRIVEKNAHCYWRLLKKYDVVFTWISLTTILPLDHFLSALFQYLNIAFYAFQLTDLFDLHLLRGASVPRDQINTLREHSIRSQKECICPILVSVVCYLGTVTHRRIFFKLNLSKNCIKHLEKSDTNVMNTRHSAPLLFLLSYLIKQATYFSL